jgi:DNA-binding NarL/FixJ family response regulator
VEPYRIVLADDHLLFRKGVRRLIEDMSDMEVIGEASDGLELLNLLNELTPDLVIVDISMPNLRGIEAAREIIARHPGIKVLVLTMHKSKEYLYHSILAGAQGYLLKEDSDSELFSAIEKICNGGTYITHALSGEMAEDLSQVYGGKGEIVRELLTTREREILKLIAEGKSSGEIGNLLFISTRTVEHHRANIMKKLNAKRSADLIRYALEKGIV